MLIETITATRSMKFGTDLLEVIISGLKGAFFKNSILGLYYEGPLILIISLRYECRSPLMSNFGNCESIARLSTKQGSADLTVMMEIRNF